MTLSRDAGQWQWAPAPSQARDHEGKQVVLYSVLIVLDDFAQRQDDVSVLGMVKVGWAKLRCLAG